MAGFLFTVFIAVLTGWSGDRAIKDNMPGGAFVAMLAGLVGAWTGGYMPIFNSFGPLIDGLAIIPSLLGAVIFVFMLGLSKNAAKQVK